ncbi:hypothetical protein RHMOL_Rhmol06G0199100 [Rhododendron molle]|uniref:Uncharacterized protein n=1 Tax=Rhododendron molle TaxID=49168 RepID=A0ACC0NEF8_RHOML|nr:hypothetical protein RHMOL_Rhmol06G0199100 [Rhododendron molle]
MSGSAAAEAASAAARALVGAAGHFKSCSSHTLPLPLVSPPTFTSVIDGSGSGVWFHCPFANSNTLCPH